MDEGLNPDDYSLQSADLPDPFVFMEGYTKVISATISPWHAPHLQSTPTDVLEKHTFLMITQGIALKAPNSKYASSDGICYSCIELSVGVYETPDLAREVVKTRIKYQPEYYPPYPNNGLKDSRAEYSTDWWRVDPI